MGKHYDLDGDGRADRDGDEPLRYGAVPRGLTAATLRTAMGGTLSLERYEALLPAFSSALVQAYCTTVNRAAMWCAQVGHESVGLKYFAEIWGPNKAQRGYEGRDDLGNTQPGDGYRFRGRGPIQLTGRSHYLALSQWAHAKGLVPSATYFVDNPDALAGTTYGFLGAVWYWTVTRPNLNRYSDAGDLLSASRDINGWVTTPNGMPDRTARWNTCRALGAALLPASGPPPPDDARRRRQVLLL